MTLDVYSMVINVMAWVIVTGGGVLIAVIGWVGRQIHSELKRLRDTLNSTNGTLVLIERDLRDDLSALDRRIVRIETQLNLRKSP